MFYEEFTVPFWSLIIPFLVLVGVLYAAATNYVRTHMITAYPEAGTEALTGEEEEHLREEGAKMRKAA